jgi:hypothetical protein
MKFWIQSSGVELLASFRKSTAELAVSFCFKEPE